MTFLARAPLSSCKSREARCSITHDRRGRTADRRKAVARKARTAPGTIQNIQRGRLKVIERWEANIRVAFIRLLETEIAKSQHELAVARLSADRVDSPAVVAAETDLERRIREAQALISRGRTPPA